MTTVRSVLGLVKSAGQEGEEGKSILQLRVGVGQTEETGEEKREDCESNQSEHDC